MQHKNASIGHRHAVHNWAVADAAARTALSVVAGDVGKICLQLDTSELYFLLDDTPMTWFKFGSGTSASATSMVVGDPGTEGSGINVNGVIYESSFKVSNIGDVNTAQTILHRHSTTLEPLIVAARSNDGTTGHTAVTNGQALFSLYAVGSTPTNYKIFAKLTAYADATGTISDTSAPGRWEFAVTPNGALAPVTALTIKNDGSILAPNISFTPTGGIAATSVAGAIAELDSEKQDKLLTLNNQTASYTLVLGDAGKLIEMDVAGANDLTVPPNSSVAFSVGTQIHGIQMGAGKTTIVAGAGVTINVASSTKACRARYSAFTLVKKATDIWYAFGDLET